MSNLVFLFVPLGVVFFWLASFACMKRSTRAGNRHGRLDSAERQSVAENGFSSLTSSMAVTESESLPEAEPETETEAPQPPRERPKTTHIDIEGAGARTRDGIRRAIGNIFGAGGPRYAPLYIHPGSSDSSPSSSSSSSSSSPSPSSREWRPSFSTLRNHLAGVFRSSTSSPRDAEGTAFQGERVSEESNIIFNMSL